MGRLNILLVFCVFVVVLAGVPVEAREIPGTEAHEYPSIRIPTVINQLRVQAGATSLIFSAPMGTVLAKLCQTMAADGSVLFSNMAAFGPEAGLPLARVSAFFAGAYCLDDALALWRTPDNLVLFIDPAYKCIGVATVKTSDGWIIYGLALGEMLPAASF